MKREYSWTHIFICSTIVLTLVVISEVRLSGQSSDTVTASDSNSTSYIFELRLDGVTVAEYTECSGLGSSNEILESETVSESGDTVITKTPGAFSWYNITLRRTGVIDNMVWAWRKAAQDGDAEQAFRDGVVIMLKANNRSQVAKWTFEQGWAASLTLNGSIEELTIVHEGLAYTTDTRPGTRWH